jgi:magnesium chelatase subunit I
MVELENCYEPQIRQAIVKARLAFDLDSRGFRAGYEAQQDAHAARLRDARAALARLSFYDAVLAHVSTLCIAAGVDGMRADLVMLRAARALAALERADAVTIAHVDRVAESVLLHRRRHDEPGSQQQDGSSAPSSSSAQHASTDTASASAEADYGYLPPEPTGLTRVKGVIPLNAKKR